ncbi:13449_t:CDS:2, partial [Dentiscutata erythropus]
MSNDTSIKFEFNQVQQQVLATGNVSIDNIDNRRSTGKHFRNDEEETTGDVIPLEQTKKLPCEFKTPQIKRPRNVPSMNNLQQESIVDTGLTTSDELNTEKSGEVNGLTTSDELNTKKSGEVNGLTTSDELNTEKSGEAKTFGVSFDEFIDSDKSEVTEPSEVLEDENDEEVKFDLNDISRELQREPAVK